MSEEKQSATCTSAGSVDS